MSILGKLFGTDDATKTVIDRTFDLVDKSFYTKEEKGKALLMAENQARQMTIEWLQATTGSRVARRIIAFAITLTWLSMFLLAAAMSVVAVWVESADTAARLVASVTLVDGRSDRMTPAVMLILGFYFAAPYMGDVAKTALTRFGK